MEVKIAVASHDEAMVLFGLGDRNLKSIRDALPVSISARNGAIRIVGERKAVEDAARILNGLLELHRSGTAVRPDYVEQQLRAQEIASPDGGSRPRPDGLRIEIEPTEKLARSPGQASYIRSVLEHDVVFCIGPAGSGKTFLAVRLAIGYLRGGDIRKIILCRPAVEAGEKLGFLPGDFQAKIHPYLRPLYDALNEILDYEQVRRYIEREIIEVIPLAYMRGRTLSNAFIILDEGQNTTTPQMKMFLTRMGLQSKIIVTGDITQVDLPPGTTSGLIHARRLMRNVRGIGWVELQKQDIVRHHLVRRIVEIYEAEDRRRNAGRSRSRSREPRAEVSEGEGEAPPAPGGDGGGAD